MTVAAEHSRPDPPPAASELDTLVGFLEFLRATLRWKCSGLDAEQLRRRHPPSTMTLGGLLKHLTYVEDEWFSVTLHGNDPAPPWDRVDWGADRDWDWHTAAYDTPDDLFAQWDAAVERSGVRLTEALDRGGLDQVAARAGQDGRAPNLRWILVHMIEEYGRHCGHADLLREAIDGSTGE